MVPYQTLEVMNTTDHLKGSHSSLHNILLSTYKVCHSVKRELCILL